MIKHSLKNNDNRAFRYTEGLKLLARSISLFTSQEQTLTQALKITAETLEVEKCLILRYDSPTNKLLPVLPTYGLPENEINQLYIELAENTETDYQLFSTAFFENRPIYSNQAHTFSRLGQTSLKVQNILILPIQLAGQAQEICVVMNKTSGPFDAQDVEALSMLANILATLPKNSNMMQQLKSEQRRHLAVLDAAVDGFIEVGRDFKITLFSKGAENLTGWSAAQARGRTCSEVLLPHSPEGELLCYNCPLQRSFRDKELIPNVETLLRTHEGEDNWVSCSYNVVKDEQDEVVSGIIAIKDIYRIKALSDELRQQIQQQESLLGVINAINGLSSIEDIYSKALGEISNAINFDLGMIHAIKENQELELMAISESEVSLSDPPTLPPVQPNNNFPNQNKPFQNPVAFFEPEIGQDKDFRRRMRRNDPVSVVLSGRTYYRQRYRHPNKTALNCEALRQNEPYMAVNLPGHEVCNIFEGFDGVQSHLCVTIKTQEATYAVLHLASYRPYAFWGSDFALALSISKQIAVAAERAHLFEQVDLLARTDPLTKLYNKREFWLRIENEMKRAERQRRPLSLLIVDLDRLKWYNDFYGHSHGDVLLAEISQLIRDKCRNTDIAFRFGGDELCVLLPDTGPREAFMVAERIRMSAIQLQGAPNDEVIIGSQEQNQVTMSIGIASFPNDALTAAELFENADSAMYRAKETGKNRSVVYDAEVDANKTNYRRRIRELENTDERYKPAAPNPANSSALPLLNSGQQVTFSINSTSFEQDGEETIIGDSHFTISAYPKGTAPLYRETENPPEEE